MTFIAQYKSERIRTNSDTWKERYERQDMTSWIPIYNLPRHQQFAISQGMVIIRNPPKKYNNNDNLNK